MRAEVDTKFSKGFFLAEESIKKIEEIVTKRLTNEVSFTKTIEAHRVDDAVVTYPSSTELVKHEENSKHDSLRGLDIRADGADGKFELNFEKGAKTRLRISSDNRDTALLLSADIKEYLKSEVLIRRLAFLSNLFNHRLTFPLIYTLSFLPIVFLAAVLKRPTTVNIATASVNQKLDYLVKSNQAATDFISVPNYTFIGVFIFIVLLGLMSTSFIYPAYTFYLGKEKARFDSRKALRDKIFWVIGVGLLVGFAGSILAGWVRF